MIGSFKFNGVESSYFNLVSKSVKRPVLPAAKLKRVELAGASGSYDFANTEYGLREMAMRITYKGNSFSELRTRARSIAAWLCTDCFAELIINDEPDKYYLAKVSDALDISTMLEAGEIEINFDCQPFAYSVIENVTVIAPIISVVHYNITNLGTREITYRSPPGSKFLITVVGSWTTLSFGVNGKTLTFLKAESGKTLIIDNIEMTATIDAVNVFNYLGGDVTTFLSILSGENDFTIGGTGLNLTSVTISFIPLWL